MDENFGDNSEIDVNKITLDFITRLIKRNAFSVLLKKKLCKKSLLKKIRSFNSNLIQIYENFSQHVKSEFHLKRIAKSKSLYVYHLYLLCKDVNYFERDFRELLHWLSDKHRKIIQDEKKYFFR